MATVGELNIMLNLETKAFRQQMATAKKALNDLAKAGERVGTAFNFNDLGINANKGAQGLQQIGGSASVLKGLLPDVNAELRSLAGALQRVGNSAPKAAEAIRQFSQAVKNLGSDELNRLASAAENAKDGLSNFRRETQSTGKESGNVTSKTSRASLALIDLGRVAEDGAFIFQDFKFGLLAVSNNLSPLVFSLGEAQKEAKKLGITLGQSLLKTLKGPAGILAAVQLFSAALIALPALFDDTGESAKDAAEDVETLRDAVTGVIKLRDDVEAIELSPRSLGFVVGSLRFELEQAQEVLREIRKELREEGPLGAAEFFALKAVEDDAEDRVEELTNRIAEYEAQIKTAAAQTEFLNKQVEEGRIFDPKRWKEVVEESEAFYEALEKANERDIEKTFGALSSGLQAGITGFEGLTAATKEAQAAFAFYRANLDKGKITAIDFAFNQDDLNRIIRGQFEVENAINAAQNRIDQILNRPLSGESSKQRNRDLQETLELSKKLSELYSADWTTVFEETFLTGFYSVTDAVSQLSVDLINLENIFESLGDVAKSVLNQIVADFAKLAAFQALKSSIFPFLNLIGLGTGTRLGNVVVGAFQNLFGIGDSSSTVAPRLQSTRLQSGDVAFSVKRNNTLSQRSGVSLP